MDSNQSSVIVYYAHPGNRHSTANRVMQDRLDSVDNLTRVDVYKEYPRHNIDVDQEQKRLLDHQHIVFQFPFFWYSTPSILKEWQDLVLEYGFAYGTDGNKLAGKTMQLVVTAGGGEEDYSANGRNNHSVRSFLLPLEQTAELCQMKFAPPYIFFDALSDNARTHLNEHVEGYVRLLQSYQNGFSPEKLPESDVITWQTLENLI